jgi:hypothetical protein
MAGAAGSPTGKTLIGNGPKLGYAVPEPEQDLVIIGVTSLPRQAAAALGLLQGIGTAIGRRRGFAMSMEAGRCWRLQTHIMAIVFVVLMPVVAMAVYTGLNAADGTRASIATRLTDTARDMAGAIDRRIETLTMAAEAPGLARGLAADGALDELYGRARQVAESLGTTLVARRRDGSTLFDTRQAFGAHSPDTALPPAVVALLARVITTGRPAISYVDFADQPLSAMLIVPALHGGQVVATLDLDVSTAQLGRPSSPIPAGGSSPAPPIRPCAPAACCHCRRNRSRQALSKACPPTGYGSFRHRLPLPAHRVGNWSMARNWHRFRQRYGSRC